MAQKWTEDQFRVINTRGKSMLVSAAAGSGKTAVLVERVLREILDPEKPVDIDRLLIVTFTRAATSQLRERVQEKVTEAYEEDPDNPRLARQMGLLHSDNIMTIDQFFLMVIRDHYEEIGLDPSFRIGDEGELKLLRSDLASEVIEEAYGQADEKFLTFAECYAPGRSDSGLEDRILEFYAASTSHPDPAGWRQGCAQNYREDPEKSVWMKEMLATAGTRLHDMVLMEERALEIAESPMGPARAADTLRDDLRQLRELAASGSYEEYCRSFGSISWGRLNVKAKKGDPPVDPARSEEVKNLRKSVKDQAEKLHERYFLYPIDAVRERMKKTGDDMDILVSLTDRFEERFREEKEKKNMIDFSDSAHFALQVLVRRQEDGSYVPTRAAESYQDHFDEVAIDEYQDSNEVQELLLWSVSRESRGEYNRFCVGDVKQSIYRFRMSDPGIFMKKYREYAGAGEGADRVRIDLHKNFRSRKEVLEAANLVFRQLMREDIGGISYGSMEALYPGAAYPEYPESVRAEAGRMTVPELIVTEPGDLACLGKEEDQVHAEAEVTAARISRIAGHDLVWDGERQEYRPAKYSDIVILLRTISGQANVYASVLAKRNIPCMSESKTGYFSSPEVETILSFLKVLDNPRQDIPLMAVLRSEIGKLTDDELALLRSSEEDSGRDLYGCVMDFIRRYESGQKEGSGQEALYGKLVRLREMTDSLREEAVSTPIHLLLWKIYDATGYEQICEASRGGRQRKANLDMLVEKAIAYESTSYRGLFHFTRYIEKMIRYQVDFGEASSPEGAGDQVRIMTIHASKGLEFPIVFVCGLGRQFNRMDSRSKRVMDARLGYGMNFVDPVRRVECPVLMKNVIADRNDIENIGEELRILYVAMTRAKEKLILTGCVKDRKELVGSLTSVLGQREEKLSFSSILWAGGMLEWVLAALVRHRAERSFFSDYLDMEGYSCPGTEELPGRFLVRTGAQVLEESQEAERQEDRGVFSLADVDPYRDYDSSLRDRLMEQTSSVYRFTGSLGIPAKVTVSELKILAMQGLEMGRMPEEEKDSVPLKEAEERNSVPLKEAEEDSRIVPEFMRQEKSGQMQGAFRGTAYHKFLADFDFTGDLPPAGAAAWLETMVGCDKISEDEASAIDPRHLDAFLRSDLAARMHEAALRGRLWRENPFVMQADAREISSCFEGTEEKVLIQGTVDACFLEEDGMVLLDYKTDHVRRDESAMLADRYRRQFELYKRAIERLTGHPVKEAVLYSLYLDRAIPVELPEKSGAEGV